MPFDTPSLPVLVNRTQSDLAGDALRRSDAQVLARAVKWHSERRVILNGHKTVVFR